MKASKIIFSGVLIVATILMFSLDASAQNRKKRKRPTERPDDSRKEKEITPFKDNLIYEIKFGNILLGNVTSISFKPAVSYKITEHISGGLAAKYQFFFVNNPSPLEDKFYSDYGLGIFARGRIFESIHLQLEYDLNWYYNIDNTQPLEDIVFYEFFPGVLAGAGYSSGFGDWAYGLDVLFMATNSLRDRTGFPFEIYGGFTYNF